MRFDTLRRSETLRMRIALVAGRVGIGTSTPGYAVAELGGLAGNIRMATTRSAVSSNAELAVGRPIIALSVTDVQRHPVANGPPYVKRWRLSSARAMRRLDSSRVPSPTQVT